MLTYCFWCVLDNMIMKWCYIYDCLTTLVQMCGYLFFCHFLTTLLQEEKRQKYEQLSLLTDVCVLGGLTSSTFLWIVFRRVLRSQPLVQDVKHLPPQINENQGQSPERHPLRTKMGLTPGQSWCRGWRQKETRPEQFSSSLLISKSFPGCSVGNTSVHVKVLSDLLHKRLH